MRNLDLLRDIRHTDFQQPEAFNFYKLEGNYRSLGVINQNQKFLRYVIYFKQAAT